MKLSDFLRESAFFVENYTPVFHPKALIFQKMSNASLSLVSKVKNSFTNLDKIDLENVKTSGEGIKEEVFVSIENNISEKIDLFKKILKHSNIEKICCDFETDLDDEKNTQNLESIIDNNSIMSNIDFHANMSDHILIILKSLNSISDFICTLCNNVKIYIYIYLNFFI